MASLNGFLRALGLRAAFGAAAAFSVVAAADAQWFPPLGAAPPGEIVERLQAEGYVLIQPLRRNGTVYLADVRAGTGGHERLVLDAWSGEILQRFVARPRIGRSGSETYFVEGGEFSSPPPLGPPPARDFFAYGGPPDAQPPPLGPVGRPERRQGRRSNRGRRPPVTRRPSPPRRTQPRLQRKPPGRRTEEGLAIPAPQPPPARRTRAPSERREARRAAAAQQQSRSVSGHGRDATEGRPSVFRSVDSGSSARREARRQIEGE